MTTAYIAPPLIPLHYLHIDGALLVVDKPSGLLSVPGRGPDKADCLISRVQADYPDALIVHRLDMETSGLVLLARGPEMHRRLSLLFQERRVEKRYVAVAHGRLEPERGEIKLPLLADWPNRPRQKVDLLSGKPSLTRYRVVGHDPARNTTWVELEPETGRTHQLRVHLMSLGHPILGDALYAPPAIRDQADRLLLHAQSLAFAHPENGQRLSLSCSAPF
ncbi:MAG TPA: RluA family pseudouridine synthase [Azospira sp.]|nr:RluA family pseudouridine synthase [Azospira sp.]